MSSPDLSLIICTLNEGAAIRGVITEIQGHLEGVDYEIVVLDDDSKDQTQAEVLALAAHDPRVRLVVRKGERGLSSAAIRGWDHARGRILGIMDGDGQHEPTAVRGLYDLMVAKDLDLASASRYANNGTSGLSLYRGAISRAGTFMAQMVLRAPLSDPLSGLFMMTRDYYLSARPNLTGVGFKILVDIVASAPRKPKFGEVCATLRTRQGGESKLDIRVVIDLVALLVEKMTRGVIPARFFMFAGVGVTGLVVHMAILSALYKGTALGFDVAMAAAILISMVWNFWVNNLLTFRDKRLSG
ncbi:MAG: glycosyltransferase, partial [Asticcacaulis sp.]